MPIPRSPSGVYMLYKNSDRSVSSYNIHWSCVCSWGDGSGHNAVPPPQHPPGSWLLPLLCSSLKLLFLYCISGRVSIGLLVPGEQLAFCPPNPPACSFLSSPFLLLYSGLLAFQQKMLIRTSFKWSLNSLHDSTLHSPLYDLWGEEWTDQHDWFELSWQFLQPFLRKKKENESVNACRFFSEANFLKIF